MPRMEGVSSFTTVWFILRRPKASRVRFCTAGQLMRLLVCVIFICAIVWCFVVCVTLPGLGVAGLNVLAAENFFDGDAAVLRYLCGRTHLGQGGYGGLYKVVGVGRTFALCKDVGHAYALEDGTHSATGLYTGTGGGGFEDDARAAEFGFLLVGDGAFVYGYADEVFLGCFYALGDSGLYLVGLTQAPAYDAVFVTDNDDGGEGEGTTTLGYFGDAVDGH